MTEEAAFVRSSERAGGTSARARSMWGRKRWQGGEAAAAPRSGIASLRARRSRCEAASVAKRSAAWAPGLQPRILDIRTLFHHNADVCMSRKEKNEIKHYAKVLKYPCGLVDIMASTEPDFGPKGWEAAECYATPRPALGEHDRRSRSCETQGKDGPQALAEDVERSMRRARAKVRRLALANEFTYFVTLTLDQNMVDRYDVGAVVKKLNAWCSNAVQRRGLRYILVPERHKDGAIHFHGFFNGALPAVDSGTIRVPWAKKPRKPRSKAEREEWLAAGGRVVYNLPGWTLGYTTAMELYGEYPAAVAYVCKYIGKGGEKPGGRWYYSGGDLREPAVEYLELSPAELANAYPDKAFVFYPPGKQMAVVNGIVLEQVQ